MEKGRVEAFSDGVIAVAITLLVLDLHVNTTGSGSLAHQLAQHWPSFAAYAVSFFVVGVIWVNHHAVFALAARVDRVTLFYNLMLLLFVTTVPFTTSTLAGFVDGNVADARLANVLYGVSMEGSAIFFTLLLHRIVRHGLLRHHVESATGRRAVARFSIGTVIYPLITVVGLFSPVLTLALYAALTTYYIIEQTPILPRA